MKTFLLTMIGAIATAISLTAMAGPDFYVIEKARYAKQAESHKSVPGDHAAMMKACREMMAQPK